MLQPHNVPPYDSVRGVASNSGIVGFSTSKCRHLFMTFLNQHWLEETVAGDM